MQPSNIPTDWTNGNFGIRVPSTDQEAESKIDSLSVDQTITLPAIEIYRCRRGQGDSVVQAYEQAMRAVLRERS